MRKILYLHGFASLLLALHGGFAAEFAVPDGIWSIDDGAFAGCSWMTSVTIPSSVMSIGTNAFYMCDNLTNITIASGNTIYSATRGMVFTGRNTGRTLLFCAPGVEGDVTVPPDTYKIAPGAFARCGKITSITIPANVMNIGSNAFWRCSSLTNITVDGNNSVYLSDGGVLYRYSLQRAYLVCCPGGLKNARPPVPPANSSGLVAVVAEIEGNPVFTVPREWAASFPRFEAMYGSDLSKALTAKTGKRDSSGRELQVWHDYVSCTDPTDSNDVFRASIAFDDGTPVISWEPKPTAEQSALRVYTVYGKARLNDEGWTEVKGDAAAYNFFKVTVRMRAD